MRLTYDDKFLFTIGQDGCLYMFELIDKDFKRGKESLMTPSEEILVTKLEEEEKKKELQNVKSKISDLQQNTNLKYELELKNKDESIAVLLDKIRIDSNEEQKRYSLLMDEKREME